MPGDEDAKHSSGAVTTLLRAWSNGEAGALDQLTPLVYVELRRLAHRQMAHEHAGHSLQTTALVNEAYLRLVDCNRMRWVDRAHFFAVSATMMRRILLDRARRRCAAKREWKPEEADLEKAVDMSSKRSHELVALDDALTELAKVDPRKARIVELRFFAGLEVKETAEVVGVSPETVMRDWKLARAWLLSELRR